MKERNVKRLPVLPIAIGIGALVLIAILVICSGAKKQNADEVQAGIAYLESLESKDPETLRITAGEVSDVLRAGGISEEKVAAFETRCEEQFGESSTLNPGNIMDSKKFQIVTPNVKISVDPEYTHVVQTKVINGRKYIVIPANEGVEVNGLVVEIPVSQNEALQND